MWTAWRYDIAFLIVAGSLVKSSAFGESAWPAVIGLFLLFGVYEARHLIPEKRDPNPEAIQRLSEEIKTLRDKISTMEFVNKMRPKVPTDARS